VKSYKNLEIEIYWEKSGLFPDEQIMFLLIWRSRKLGLSWATTAQSPWNFNSRVSPILSWFHRHATFLIHIFTPKRNDYLHHSSHSWSNPQLGSLNSHRSVFPQFIYFNQSSVCFEFIYLFIYFFFSFTPFVRRVWLDWKYLWPSVLFDLHVQCMKLGWFPIS
jgi:hypothetical protein